MTVPKHLPRPRTDTYVCALMLQVGRSSATESKKTAQKAQAARQNTPTSEAADTRAVVAPNQPEGTAAAQRLADEHAALQEDDRATTTTDEAGPATSRRPTAQAEVLSQDASEIEAAQLDKALEDSAREARELAELIAIDAHELAVRMEASSSLDTTVPVEEDEIAIVTAPTAAPLSVTADGLGPAGSSSSAHEADRTCVVCMHQPQSDAALPCLHLIYCGDCAALMRGKPCALCMREVSEIREVFRG